MFDEVPPVAFGWCAIPRPAEGSCEEVRWRSGHVPSFLAIEVSLKGLMDRWCVARADGEHGLTMVETPAAQALGDASLVTRTDWSQGYLGQRPPRSRTMGNLETTLGGRSTLTWMSVALATKVGGRRLVAAA